MAFFREKFGLLQHSHILFKIWRFAENDTGGKDNTTEFLSYRKPLSQMILK